MNACFVSDVGKVRKVNEDSGGIYYNQSNQMLTIIADGMGGHKAGDVASQLSSTYMKELWEETGELTSEEVIKDWLEEAIMKTNEYVLSHAHDHQECVGMGTTLVATIYFDEYVIVGHVGDSRLYHVTNEEIRQVTEDHSFVQQLVNNGELTEEEAEYHPKKNVLLQAVGTESNLRIDINTFQWREHEYVLSCTDGLSNKLSSYEMMAVIQGDHSLEEKVDELVSLANQNGGEDNISVVLVQRKAGEAT
ncbi:Stp1/IreP family PP2C-type Ser/Thr phosphatase [Tenuibacillus multivorans]|uniref:protein-serine/threonine phosphatase n=1 Tax=Tenuibacillus multivorans TaxID=237069 RepID=A0A1G9Y2V9_9BACI|nr:Stp1/IreP family PP2C-type Ser/Thr phosphatase [Tenuibacillus multivorans]GEL75925.1 protein phosphatase [Tenuibacillus multivorans]SDN03360.1 protein phosphatase [Tenuibacillus multivorans]